MNIYNVFDLPILLGLDDIAHNRLLRPRKGSKGEYVRVKNYGKRNKKEKCYCEIIKKLTGKR